MSDKQAHKNLKRKLHEIIFEADTRPGKIFDVLLILMIIASVQVVMIDSIESVRNSHGDILYGLEWFFTILFTLEYLLRIYSIGKPIRYMVSFFGIIDLLSILPTYLSLLIPGSQFLLVIRVLRLLRVFRVLKLVQYLAAADMLATALKNSMRKVTVFLFTVIILVVVFGSLMYVIEGADNGFTSIPQSIYWAIVTLTTVGYGDISPVTTLGKSLAAIIMILGYGIIAVPTGIVSVELNRTMDRKTVSTQVCPECSHEGHDPDAKYCKICGSKM